VTCSVTFSTLTMIPPRAINRLLARIQTQFSIVASSSITGPRPMHNSWWIGISVLPMTTEISRSTRANRWSFMGS